MGEVTASVLSVSDFVGELGRLIEHNIRASKVEGEIHEITVARSGHAYFTLKDQGGQLSAVMWAMNARRYRSLLCEGALVICSGKPTIYRPQGRLQLVVDSVEAAGEGALKAKFDALKAKLESEGLFDPARKRPIPFLPRCIGIVTSTTGAVIHDMRVKLDERFPGIPTVIEDVPVQGEGAAKRIAQAIAKLSANEYIDVLIVARGGGSLEDLWSFNEEVVARAVFAAKKPIISGVGHESDVTLCDLVADVRAPTPTAAAEMVVPRLSDLRDQLLRAETGLRRVERLIGERGQAVDLYSERFEAAVARNFSREFERIEHLRSRALSLHPRRLLHRQCERLHTASTQLDRSVEMALERSRLRFQASQLLPALSRFALRMKELSHLVQRSQQMLATASNRALKASTLTSTMLEQRLRAASPEAVLARGYAIVFQRDALVKDLSELAHEDFTVQFSSGSVTALPQHRDEQTVQQRWQQGSKNGSQET